MENDSKLIEDLKKQWEGEYNPLKHWFIKKKIIIRGKYIVPKLLEFLGQPRQEIIIDIADILGKIGEPEAVPFLIKLLEKDNPYLGVPLNAAIALLKLGEKAGYEFLKNCISDSTVHRELRIESAKALIKFNCKNVFGECDEINFTGVSMSLEWSAVLEKLVSKLRKKNNAIGEIPGKHNLISSK